jgi:DNA-binding FadR family transcriptional regulator
MLLKTDGDVDLAVVRGVMEMRSAMAPDAARLCARRDRRRGHVLLRIVEQMDAAGGDLPKLQVLGLQFWDDVVDGADNLAYRLALNSLRRIYDPVREAMAGVLAAELTDGLRHWRLSDAIARGDEHGAHLHATELMNHGLDAVMTAITALQDDDVTVTSTGAPAHSGRNHE